MATPTRQPLMAGNWKENLNHLEAIALVQKLAFSLTDDDLDAVEEAVLPPFTDIRSVQTMVDGAKLGCTYTIVAHSERRQFHHEDDTVANLKVRAAFRHGLVPILCVGEGLDVRREGRHVEHTLTQLDGGLRQIPVEHAAQIVIAYEPVWAIGTGEVATPEDAQQVCSAIRARIAELYSSDVAEGVRILYGGSVKASNIGPIMEQPDVDGALVGGASLEADEFAVICRYRDHPPR